MDMQYLAKHWYAYIYEQQEIQTDDVQLILALVGNEPKRILEVACGGGRILIPLATAGHTVTGFDSDQFMLERCQAKAKEMPNITCYLADAVEQDWDDGFDMVVLAGNILVNIEATMDYRQSQRLFIQKAYDCLHRGGHLFLDMDNYTTLQSHVSGQDDERVYFEGTDDLGTYGWYSLHSDNYDSQTQITSFVRNTVITAKSGTAQVFERRASKYFPTLHQVQCWVTESGFTIRKTFDGGTESPLTDTSRRITMWAEKA